MGNTNATGGPAPPAQSTLPLRPPPYSMTSHTLLSSPSSSTPEALPMTGQPSQRRQVIFAKRNLHDFIADPASPDLILCIYTSINKERGMEINLMETPLDKESKKLLEYSTPPFIQMDIKLPHSTLVGDERKRQIREAQVQVAEKLLDGWALYGQDVFGTVIVLAGADEIRCFISKRG